MNTAAQHAGPACGVYRVRGDADDLLLHIGQGVVGSRLTAHLSKCNDQRVAKNVVFGSAKRLECSYVVTGELLDHQRLEVENDLIASHLLSLGAVPPAQFIG